MIHFRMVGQFANQALQYVLARILADRTGLDYRAPAGFRTKAGEPVTWYGDPLFAMESAPGRRAADGTPQVIDALQWLDLSTIDPQRPVIVRQWFGQRYEILRPYRDRIRDEWLRLAPDRLFDAHPDEVCIHVRRTDYLEYQPGRAADPLHQGTATTVRDFARCLDEFPEATRVRIVSDEGGAAMNDFVADLARATNHRFTIWRVPWTVAPWDIDFLALASARWVILSQSTFSWLAAFLGRAERVVCSVRPGTFWGNGVGLHGPQMGPGGRDFPNLFVDDEPGRWRWIGE